MSYNYDTTHNSPNYTPEAQSPAVFGQPRVIKGITIHWWGDPSTNPSFEGVRDYLCRPNGDTSAHLVVTGDGRQVACIVNYNDVAWHAGNATGNATTIGIECDPRCRDEDYDVIAEVVADIRSAFGDVPIYSHRMWTQTTCPGNYDINRIDQLSYTKQSNAQWGQVTDKNPPAVPPVVPSPAVITPAPAPHQTQPIPAPTATPVTPPQPVQAPVAPEPMPTPPQPVTPVVEPIKASQPVSQVTVTRTNIVKDIVNQLESNKTILLNIVVTFFQTSFAVWATTNFALDKLALTGAIGAGLSAVWNVVLKPALKAITK